MMPRVPGLGDFDLALPPDLGEQRQALIVHREQPDLAGMPRRALLHNAFGHSFITPASFKTSLTSFLILTRTTCTPSSVVYSSVSLSRMSSITFCNMSG